MAQKYREPIAHERGQCDLLPRGVTERIEQYRTDTEETR
jgi:hypothetical protein